MFFAPDIGRFLRWKGWCKMRTKNRPETPKATAGPVLLAVQTYLHPTVSCIKQA
jgi:hypothetical protein